MAGVDVGALGPFGRSLRGHVYRITDPEAFFLPILLGQGPPAQRYEPWSRLEVRTWSVNDQYPIPFPGGTAQTATDGGFEITQTPPNPTLGGGVGQPSDIRFSLRISEAVFPFRPLYRSDLSLSGEAAETTELDVWLLQEPIDVEDGATAGDLSGVLADSGLPATRTSLQSAVRIPARARGTIFALPRPIDHVDQREEPSESIHERSVEGVTGRAKTVP